MQKIAALQTLRTNLYLFVWVFMTLFFVGCMFVAYFMKWTDERLVILLSGAIGSSINAIAMLTNTALKGNNRLSDIGGASGSEVDTTTETTLKSETTTIERSPEPKKKNKEKL